MSLALLGLLPGLRALQCSLARAQARQTWKRRFISTVNVSRPPASAPRESPTPLAFVSASQWDPTSQEGLKQLAERLATKGFVCVHCDIDLGKPHEVRGVPQSSESLMKHFESEFVSCLSQSPSPFPPVIFARGPGSLIAQTFISSHRAGGMFLISPPPSNADVPKHLLPTPLPEFDFEMKFPIALMGTAEEIEKLQQHRDLTKTGYVDTYVVDAIDKDTVLLKAEEWLDELNI